MPKNLINFSRGSKFGLWTIIKLKRRIKYGSSVQKVFLCRCECGTKQLVNQSNLLNKIYKSPPRCKKCASKNIHNLTKYKGLSNSKSYSCWINMIRRCYNKKCKFYNYYGGRGIKVCKRWLKSFLNFYKDLGEQPEGLSLDRINSNKNYKPSNCKWSTRKEQANNRNNVPKDKFSAIKTQQIRYQRRRISEGKCPICGQPKGITQLCDKCRNKRNKKRRKKQV